MAIPVIPFLLLGLLLAGKKKRKKKPEEEKPLVITSVTKARAPITAARAVPQGKPGAYCRPPKGSAAGTYATYDGTGRCIVFWTPETDGVVIEALKNAYESASNKNELCQLWKENPARNQLIKRVILDLFPDLPAGKLPAGTGSGYRVSIVWNLSAAHFDRHLCGYAPVS